jgi:hypothetical protein
MWPAATHALTRPRGSAGGARPVRPMPRLPDDAPSLTPPSQLIRLCFPRILLRKAPRRRGDAVMPRARTWLALAGAAPAFVAAGEPPPPPTQADGSGGMARLPRIYPRAPALRPLLHRRCRCPRGPTARGRAPRARGAQPRPVLHLWCARGGGRVPPRTTRAAFRKEIPTFSGSRGLGCGTRKTQAEWRGSAGALLNISPPPSPVCCDSGPGRAAPLRRRSRNSGFL